MAPFLRYLTAALGASEQFKQGPPLPVAATLGSKANTTAIASSDTYGSGLDTTSLAVLPSPPDNSEDSVPTSVDTKKPLEKRLFWLIVLIGLVAIMVTVSWKLTKEDRLAKKHEDDLLIPGEQALGGSACHRNDKGCSPQELLVEKQVAKIEKTSGRKDPRPRRMDAGVKAALIDEVGKSLDVEAVELHESTWVFAKMKKGVSLKKDLRKKVHKIMCADKSNGACKSKKATYTDTMGAVSMYLAESGLHYKDKKKTLIEMFGHEKGAALKLKYHLVMEGALKKKEWF